MSWWNENGSLPFPQEFSSAASSDLPDHDLQTVELHGPNQFRWRQAVFSSVSELKRELLDRWHERMYPILDAHRTYASAVSDLL
jgi:hypothetical protein